MISLLSGVPGLSRSLNKKGTAAAVAEYRVPRWEMVE